MTDHRSIVFTFLSIATIVASPSLYADENPRALEIKEPSSKREFSVGPELVNVPVEEIERAYEGRNAPEAIRMYLAIIKGSRMGAGDGWFGPAQSRYDWNWLAKRHGIKPDEGISAGQFVGAESWFVRLDRNRDGKIMADDLDWSDRNSWVQQAYMINRLFRKIDPSGDGKLTREEWQKFFEIASQGKDVVTPEDLRDIWLGGMSAGFLTGDAPTPDLLLKGLFTGEIGSLQEGPRVDELAPDFALMTHDGTQSVQLSKQLGTKPIVLIFGNFTCGPFRSMYPGVEDIYRRFKDEAMFLGVYVREAHPTDGWKMESNTKVGVSVAQPTNYAERVAVAKQCYQLLKSTIPLLVDEIDDPTGNAYSGMPARLYVIDQTGRVAYKSGRGPFGFKSGEMEQALLMTLLDGNAITVPEADSVTPNSQVKP